MNNLDKYKGIIPAFYACYDEDGNIDIQGVKELTQYFINKNVKGVYVNGSSGECIYLSKEERKELLEAVVEAAGGKLTIIAHVACNNTQDSMELAAHAQSLGVDAIAAIPPIYFHLPEYSIEEYWNDISSVADKTDFILYHIPQLAGVELTETLFSKMLRNPRVIGVKSSSMPILDIVRFKSVAKKEIIVFNGSDEQYIGGRMIGADGGIGGTYAVMPDLYLKLENFFTRGEYEPARELQMQLDQIIFEMCSGRANMYAIAKEILMINEQINIGSVRKPLTALTEPDKSIAKSVAHKIQILRNDFVEE